MEMDLANFGKIIKFHRKKSGLNQLELANLSGVGKTAIFDIEHNKNTVKLETLLKVTKTLNITINLTSPIMEAYEKS